MTCVQQRGRCPGLGEPRAFGPAEEQKRHPPRGRVFTTPGRAPCSGATSCSCSCSAKRCSYSKLAGLLALVSWLAGRCASSRSWLNMVSAITTAFRLRARAPPQAAEHEHGGFMAKRPRSGRVPCSGATSCSCSAKRCSYSKLAGRLALVSWLAGRNKSSRTWFPPSQPLFDYEHDGFMASRVPRAARRMLRSRHSALGWFRARPFGTANGSPVLLPRSPAVQNYPANANSRSAVVRFRGYAYHSIPV